MCWGGRLPVYVPLTVLIWSLSVISASDIRLGMIQRAVANRRKGRGRTLDPVSLCSDE